MFPNAAALPSPSFCLTSVASNYQYGPTTKSRSPFHLPHGWYLTLETCYGCGISCLRIRPSGALRYEVLGPKSARGYVLVELRSVYVPIPWCIPKCWARSLGTYIPFLMPVPSIDPYYIVLKSPEYIYAPLSYNLSLVMSRPTIPAIA